MATRYTRGRDVEYRIQRDLESRGWSTIRAAGSKGKNDIVAWDDTLIRFIQAKSYIDKPTSAAEDIAVLRATPRPANSRAELWIWQQRRGWQAKVLIGPREEEDGLLPLAEADNDEAGRYDPTIVGSDGHPRLLDQSLSLEQPPAAETGDRRQVGRGTHGTSTALHRIGFPHLRDVLQDLRADKQEAERPQVLRRKLPARRPKQERPRKDQRQTVSRTFTRPSRSRSSARSRTPVLR